MFDHGIRAPALAEALSVDRTTITRYLRGNRVPSVRNAILIADYFGCSMAFLFGASEDSSGTVYKPVPPFSDRLKTILERKRYSRYRLCKEAHFSCQIVDDWYHGKRLPTIDNIIKLANFFDCSLDDLIGRE